MCALVDYFTFPLLVELDTFHGLRISKLQGLQVDAHKVKCDETHRMSGVPVPVGLICQLANVNMD